MKASFLYIVLLFCYCTAKGQGNDGAHVWKKEVSRIIDTRTINKQDVNETSLLETIIAKVKEGVIQAYDVEASGLSLVMTMERFKKMVDGQTDTVEVSDSISGHTSVQYVHHGLLTDSIHKYKVVEDWTFDPVAGKIDIQIAYIAPVYDVYADDSTYRGSQSLFRIRYNDFVTLLSTTHTKELEAFLRLVWQSYFAKDSSITASWNADATFQIDMTEPEDTIPHFLKDEHEDSNFAQCIYIDIVAGKLPAWNGAAYPFDKPITSDSITKHMERDVDTIEVRDPVTNVTMIEVTHHGIIYEYAHHYKILGSWSLNPKEGKTEITLKSIGPISDYYHDEEPLFYVKYQEVQPILQRIEQYHPEHTFAAHIWDALLLSDSKPVRER